MHGSFPADAWPTQPGTIITDGPAPRTLPASDLTTLPWRCAALSLGAHNGGLWNEGPPEVTDASTVEVLARVDDSRQLLRAAFAAWMTAAAAGESRPARSQAAADALHGAAGALPDHLGRLGTPRFAGADFATPAAWVAAEWAATLDALIEPLTSAWEDATDALAADTTPLWMALGPVGAYSGRDHDMNVATAVWSAYPTVPIPPGRVADTLAKAARNAFSSQPPLTAARVPAPVARWLSQVLFSGFAQPLPHAQSTHTPAMVETALALWDPEEGVDNLAVRFAQAEQLYPR